MNGFLKKYWKGIVSFFVIGVVIIPLLIHCAFKATAPWKFLVATWSSGDVLAFYGVIVGAVATVGGVYLSIQYSQQAAREDMHDKVRPFLVVTPLMVEGKVDLISELLMPKAKKIEEQSTYYKEYILDRVCFVLRNGKVSAHSKLTPEQEEAKRKFGRRQTENEKGEPVITAADVTTMSIVVENLGVGVANRLLIGFNKEQDDQDQMVLTVPLKVNATLTLEVYIENPQTADYGTYILRFEYQDIYENTYQQSYHVTLSKGKTGSELFFLNEGRQVYIGNAAELM